MVYKEKLIENESIFRSFNEKVQRDIAGLRRLAKQHHEEQLMHRFDQPLFFYCECSKGSCKNRVQVDPKEYDRIHKQRDRFIVLNGHESGSIEKVVRRSKEYTIVEKFANPPEIAPGRSVKPNKT